MPTIVDYPLVVQRLAQQRLRCLYHNSGAFGFEPGIDAFMTGWIGADDPSIRPAARQSVIQFDPPHEPNVAAGFERVWRGSLAGPIWLMPASHWTYELDFGNADWLPDALRESGI